MPRTVQPKRIKVDAWITEGLRQAVGGLVRKDGKPATEEQVREWCQGQIDDATATVVNEFEAHGAA